MITVTGYKHGMNNEVITRTFESDDPNDVKPINDPVTGVNKKYGKITMGSVFIYITNNGLDVYKFKESANTWQKI